MTDTPRVDACANGDLGIYPLARQLERELAAAQKDAERYRWLKNNQWDFNGPTAFWDNSSSELDAAIDAARSPGA